MTATGWFWVAVATVLAALDWAAVAAGSRVLERCAKPAVLLALIAAALTAQPGHGGVQRWLVLALCFGLIGDVALSFAGPGQLAEPRVPAEHPMPVEPAGPVEPQVPNQPQGPAEQRMPVEPVDRPAVGGRPLAAAIRSDTGALVGTARPVATGRPTGGAHRAQRPAGSEVAEPPRASVLFAAGLASFLLGHLCYCAAILAYGTDQLSLGFGLVLVLLALLAFGHRILAGAQLQGGNALTIAVAAYITTLGSTVVLGIGTTSLAVATGIVLFACSDLVLATDRFVVRRSWAPLTVAVSYHLAQALLLLGLVR
jgi:uncharacterized membrane protein YhhN